MPAPQKRSKTASVRPQAALGADEGFLKLSKFEGDAIVKRDEEDAEKLQRGVDSSIAKGVLPKLEPPPTYQVIDVLGKTPDDVCNVIIAHMGAAANTGGVRRPRGNQVEREPCGACRGRDAESAWTGRGDAAAATWIFCGVVAEPDRLRSRCWSPSHVRAAAATRLRGLSTRHSSLQLISIEYSRRRRAAAATRLRRLSTRHPRRRRDSSKEDPRDRSSCSAA